jgi:hypothetical protein
MSLPQVLTAITASLLGAGIAKRNTTKRVLLLGLAANVTSMIVLVVTAGIETNRIAYPLLRLHPLPTGHGQPAPSR